MNKKQTNIVKLQGQLTHWLAEIERLKKKADSSDPENNAETSRRIQELREMRDAAQQELREIQKRGEKDWNDIMDQVSSSRGIHETLR